LNSTELVIARPADARQLRSFGLLVGGLWALIGVWPVLARGGTPRLWAVVLAAALLLPALIVPARLRPIHRMWMAVGDALGWVNTRVILGVVFFLIITPMGLIMRLLREDPLCRSFDGRADTYRVRRPPRKPTHLLRQY
jgi:hypothetical protein